MGKKRKRSRSPSSKIAKLVDKLNKALKSDKRHRSSTRSPSSHRKSPSHHRRSPSSHRYSSSATDGAARKSRSRSPSPQNESGSSSLATPERSPERSVTFAPTMLENSTVSEVSPLGSEPTEKELRPEVMSLLGDLATDKRPLPPNLHAVIATAWAAVARSGLAATDRVDLVEKYPLPENIGFLAPPKRNAELDDVLNDANQGRDSRIGERQRCVAAALAALGRVISQFLEAETPELGPLACLLDAGRLMVDAFHEESVVRRSLILTQLREELRAPISKTEIGEFLFDVVLSEKVKQTKALAQSAAELKSAKPKPAKNFSAPPKRQAPPTQTAQGGQKSSFHQNQRGKKASYKTYTSNRSHRPRSKERRRSDRRSPRNKSSYKRR